MMPLDTTRLPDPDRHAEFYADVTTKRAIAWVIDTVAIGTLCAVVVVLTLFTAVFVLPVLYLSIGFVYRWVFLTRASATPGMRLASILFLDRTGARLDAPTAFLHTLGTSLSFLFVIPQIASVAMMMTNRRGQGLTDMVLGTVAMNRAAET